jgi:tRNA 2-selenouridine synthase SelU
MSKIAFSWDLLEKSLIIDVRSEIEFEKGHIPGAVNIPILNTEERKIVGTSFKQNGQNRPRLLCNSDVCACPPGEPGPIL